MPKMTGARVFAEMMQGYEVSHLFFVPAFMLKAFAEMEDMPIKRLVVHEQLDVPPAGHPGRPARHRSTRAGTQFPNMVSILGDAKTYAIAPHPWTPTGRDFHSYQRTGA